MRIPVQRYHTAINVLTANVDNSSSQGYSRWRTSVGNNQNNAANVYIDGSLNNDCVSSLNGYVDCVPGCVRPALWIDISAIPV